MHVLGIDAGGTKTVAYLASGEGTILAEARAGGANLQLVGERGVEQVLREIRAQTGADPTLRPDLICVGVAGTERTGETGVVRRILSRLWGNVKTLVVNDALPALVAGVGEAPGIVIICGTGSIVYGRSGRAVAARAGGWGHLLGDEGSGYWIGLRALRAVAHAYDGRGPATGLTPRLLAHFGAALWPDLHEGRERLTPPTVAALAPQVEAERAAGDRVALAILEEAVDELAGAASSVMVRLGMQEERFGFVLAGGVLTGMAWLSEELARRLKAMAPQSTVNRLEVEPALGAVRLALSLARGENPVPRYLD